jgi:hypothetical protein
MPGGDLWTAKGRGFEHTGRIYAELQRRSIPTADGDRLFCGSLQGLMVALGYTSSQQYHQVKGRLVAMGCIEQLRRGTARRPTVWLLKAAPSVEAWDAYVRRPFSRRAEQTQREAMPPASGVLSGDCRPLAQVARALREAGVKTAVGVHRSRFSWTPCRQG